MHFKKILILFLAFILLESSSCPHKANPGLVELEVELMDESGVPVAGAMLGLFESKRQDNCLQDTFFTNAKGVGKYSFLPSTDPNYSDYGPGRYFTVGFYEEGKFPVSTKSFEGNGKRSFVLVAKEVKPYLAVTVKPSNADSLYLWNFSMQQIGLGHCSAIDGVASYTSGGKKILNTSQENQLVFDVVPNDTTQLRVRTYEYQSIKDTIYNIVIGSSAVELIIE